MSVLPPSTARYEVSATVRPHLKIKKALAPDCGVGWEVSMGADSFSAASAG